MTLLVVCSFIHPFLVCVRRTRIHDTLISLQSVRRKPLFHIFGNADGQEKGSFHYLSD